MDQRFQYLIVNGRYIEICDLYSQINTWLKFEKGSRTSMLLVLKVGAKLVGIAMDDAQVFPAFAVFVQSPKALLIGDSVGTGVEFQVRFVSVAND